MLDSSSLGNLFNEHIFESVIFIISFFNFFFSHAEVIICNFSIINNKRIFYCFAESYTVTLILGEGKDQVALKEDAAFLAGICQFFEGVFFSNFIEAKQETITIKV